MASDWKAPRDAEFTFILKKLEAIIKPLKLFHSDGAIQQCQCLQRLHAGIARASTSRDETG
jgi:hypothetical protein